MEPSNWLEETYDDDVRLGFRVREILVDKQSKFQRVQIVDTYAMGKVLALDGLFMTSEKDEFFYHEMIVHPAMTTLANPQKVLVIGGGDGGTIREICRYPQVQSVTMVEIDGDVIDACKTHLPSLGADAWNDPRLDLRVADGIAYVAEAPEATFDLIILDGSDPVGPAEGLFGTTFYENVKRVLKPDGVFVLQSESPTLMPKLFTEVQTTLRQIFEQVTPYFGPVPLYGGSIWSWTIAGDEHTPLNIRPERVELIQPTAKLYTPELHRSALTTPGYVKALLGT